MDRKKHSNLSRYTHEIFLSLNLGFMLKLAMSEEPRPSITWESTMWPKLNSYLHLHPHDSLGFWIGFFAVALVLTLIIFLVLETVLRFSGREDTILSAAGISSLFLFPTLCLYQNYYRNPVPTLPHPSGILLSVELAAILACSICYLQKWLGGPRIIILVILIHFAFWGWLYLGGAYFWRAPAQSVFPAIGLCSALAWVSYLYKERNRANGAEISPIRHSTQINQAH